MEKSRLGILTLVGLLLAAVGVVAPIVWDIYKTRSALELHTLSTSTVVDSVKGIEKLEFSYDGKPVPRLSKIDLVLINTGRTPIRHEDVISPVRVLVEDTKILDARIQQLVPQNLNLSATVDLARKAVTLTFPLLNPGDLANISLLVAGNPTRVLTDGRISGVREVLLVDKRDELNSPWHRNSWTVWLVVVFTGFCFLIVTAGIYAKGKEDQIANFVTKGLFVLPTVSTPQEYLEFLNQTFKDVKSYELKSIQTYLAAIPPNNQLTEEQRTQLRDMIRAALTNTKNTANVLIAFSVITLIGIGYIITNFK